MRPYVELRIGEVALTHQSDETITIPWVARNTGSSAASRVFVVTAQSNKNRAIIPFKSTALGTFNMLYPDEEQGGRADLNLAFPVDTTYLHTIVMYTYGIPMIYQKTEEDQLLTYVRLTTFQVLRKWDNSIDFKTQGSVERGFRGNLKIHEFVFDHPGYDMALSLPNITFEQRGDSLFIIAD
jgi:hypothetical protein